jgi:hypothetical protein
MKRHSTIIMAFGAVSFLIFLGFSKFSESGAFNQQLPDNENLVQTPKKKTILMWTTVFGLQSGTLDDCPLKNQCEFTYDKSLLHSANAVVFHASDVHQVQHFPSPTSPNQKFVFLSMETPENLQAQGVFDKFQSKKINFLDSKFKNNKVAHPFTSVLLWHDVQYMCKSSKATKKGHCV